MSTAKAQTKVVRWSKTEERALRASMKAMGVKEAIAAHIKKYPHRTTGSVEQKWNVMMRNKTGTARKTAPRAPKSGVPAVKSASVKSKGMSASYPMNAYDMTITNNVITITSKS